MGLLVQQAGKRFPTRAAILLFGANRTFRQILPRPVVDCRRYGLPRDEADTDVRCLDRLVLVANLVRTWRALLTAWYPRVAERPFRVNPDTTQRDSPADDDAFLEALVNLVLHQDFADLTRWAVIRHYSDQAVFWNPGDAMASDADLLTPYGQEVRNPRLVRAFRRIGASADAGWGLGHLFRVSRELGHPPPVIGNDERRKSFELVLSRSTQALGTDG